MPSLKANKTNKFLDIIDAKPSPIRVVYYDGLRFLLVPFNDSWELLYITEHLPIITNTRRRYIPTPEQALEFIRLFNYYWLFQSSVLFNWYIVVLVFLTHNQNSMSLLTTSIARIASRLSANSISMLYVGLWGKRPIPSAIARARKIDFFKKNTYQIVKELIPSATLALIWLLGSLV